MLQSEIHILTPARPNAATATTPTRSKKTNKKGKGMKEGIRAAEDGKDQGGITISEVITEH